MPRTKIVCTIGPASESPESIRELIKGGMDVARLHFSHGSRGEHGEKIQIIRRISEELGGHSSNSKDRAARGLRIYRRDYRGG
jgi:pyruvate kinase